MMTGRTLSGVLIVDKPGGITSHDVVQRVRRKLSLRKVGHAGTLDPDATGVLVICVGEATRLLEYITAEDKAYEAEIVFGRSTDTDDASGRTVETADAAGIKKQTLQDVLKTFVGDIRQTVPAYSAVHIEGRRAYDLARNGETFQLPSRRVHISLLDLQGFQSGSEALAKVFVHCSKGTYVRSLCRDIGGRLGVPAHMGALRRVRSGIFTLDDAVNLENWEESLTPECALRPALAAVSLQKMEIQREIADRLANGQRVWVPQIGGISAAGLGEQLAVVNNRRLVAVAEIKDARGAQWLLQPHKVFWKKDR